LMSKNNMECDVAIIGGGAGGLLAAIHAAQTAAQYHQPVSILILEKQERVGRKLLATGNGRCNLSNIVCSVTNYHGSNSVFIDQVLELYPPVTVMDFFASLGIICREEENGRVYPYSGQAAAVLDLLRLKAAALDVNIITSQEVQELLPQADDFVLHTNDMTVIARKVIVAAGGAAASQLSGGFGQYDLLEKLGHRLTPLYPALVQVKTQDKLPKALQGIKIEGAVSLLHQGRLLRREEGEILFTEYGLSGPPILQLSRAISVCPPADLQEMLLLLDILPSYSQKQLLELLKQKRKQNDYLNLEYFLLGLVNKKLGMLLLKQLGLTPLSRLAAGLSDDELQKIALMLKALPLYPSGTRGWSQAQVTAGGLLTEDFCPQSMESLLHKGLYAIGEILDVDGDCGGYNLQWAFASGLVAGKAVVLSLIDEEMEQKC
jgi:predicted Rossmann fold flavoprotein